MNNQEEESLAVIPGAFCNTRDMAERWNASVSDVRSWCRDGFVTSAQKVSAKWRIPSDSKRPLDRKLTEEILWTLLESRVANSFDIDLSHWGVAKTDIATYLRLMEKDGSVAIGDGGAYRLSKRGFMLLGRNGAKSKTTFRPRAFLLELAASGTAEVVGNALFA